MYSCTIFIFGDLIFFNFRQLGSMGSFTDLSSKLELLSFSVTHCPVEEISIVLRERRIVEAQVSQ